MHSTQGQTVSYADCVVCIITAFPSLQLFCMVHPWLAAPFRILHALLGAPKPPRCSPASQGCTHSGPHKPAQRGVRLDVATLMGSLCMHAHIGGTGSFSAAPSVCRSETSCWAFSRAEQSVSMHVWLAGGQPPTSTRGRDGNENGQRRELGWSGGPRRLRVFFQAACASASHHQSPWSQPLAAPGEAVSVSGGSPETKSSR